MQAIACSCQNQCPCGAVPKRNDFELQDIEAKTPTAKRARVSESASATTAQLELSKNSAVSFVTPQTQNQNVKTASPELSKEEVRSLLIKEAGFDADAERTDAWTKRQDYLGWDDFFFAVSVLSSRRSKNPVKPYGACIVDAENRVVGIGYDGLPRGCPDDCIPFQVAEAGRKLPFLHTQNPYICHAEVNAILNKCSSDVAGCRMYVERFPCKSNGHHVATVKIPSNR